MKIFIIAIATLSSVLLFADTGMPKRGSILVTFSQEAIISIDELNLNEFNSSSQSCHGTNRKWGSFVINSNTDKFIKIGNQSYKINRDRVFVGRSKPDDCNLSMDNITEFSFNIIHTKFGGSFDVTIIMSNGKIEIGDGLRYGQGSINIFH